MTPNTPETDAGQVPEAQETDAPAAGIKSKLTDAKKEMLARKSRGGERNGWKSSGKGNQATQGPRRQPRPRGPAGGGHRGPPHQPSPNAALLLGTPSTRKMPCETGIPVAQGIFRFAGLVGELGALDVVGGLVGAPSSPD